MKAAVLLAVVILLSCISVMQCFRGAMFRLGTRHAALRPLVAHCGTSAASSSSIWEVGRSFKHAEQLESAGKALAKVLDAGDVVLLTGTTHCLAPWPLTPIPLPLCALAGDLGAGKTTFARGIVRAKCEDDEMRVTSPSFLIDNAYEISEGLLLHHTDLYRLPDGCDLGFLSIPSIFASSLCLIEWPERLAQRYVPEQYLEVRLSIQAPTDGDQQDRTMQLKCVGDKWIRRIDALKSALYDGKGGDER